ncbi:unnamed protein product, partial [Amoebophrya sp. A120]|eukprot:GSA120T00004790001.1
MASLEWREVVFSARDPETGTQTDILRNMSGRVEGGGTLAILGPSGSGKSSLLKALAGQIRTTVGALHGRATISGSVSLNNEESVSLQNYPFSEGVKLVSLIEQQDLFIGEVTVSEHLSFYAALRLFHLPRKQRQDRIAAILRRLRLSHCQHRKVYLLSGGEQKRLSVAEELLNEQTSVLLLDEPTTGLDSVSAKEMVDILCNN